MKIPIRNYTDGPLMLFIETICDEYEIPHDGEAIVTLEDGQPHSIDIHSGGQWITIWDEGREINATVEVYPTRQSLIPDDRKPVERPE